MASLSIHLLALAMALLLPLCCHSQLTTADRQEALSFTNFLRRNVIPKAGDMNGLLWDSRLARLAQEAANTCQFEHRYDGAYASLGENIYRGGRRNMTEILMLMFLERENYDYQTDVCDTSDSSKYPMFGTCGHYLQLVTAKLIKMGCGLKLCNDGIYIMYCEYDTGFTVPPYQPGQPGTMCNHMQSTYTQNGLCYYKAPGKPAPVKGTLDCNLTCLNYGNKSHDSLQCSCTCPTGFTGIRCERKTSASSSVPNDCRAQLVTCQNGGTPTMTGSICRCVCPNNFRGDACEENIAQAESSVFWYFGQAMRLSSYYPVDPKIWTSMSLEMAVQYYLTHELNEYCKVNYQACCANSASATTDVDFVDYGDFAVTDNYPRNVLDGSLKVGVHFRIPSSANGACGGSYVSRSAVLAAAEKAKLGVEDYLNILDVKTIKYE